MDGDDRVDGYHAMGCFFDNAGKMYLFGAWDRCVMNQSAVGEIKRVDVVLIGR
jgi:hypothetical protein